MLNVNASRIALRVLTDATASPIPTALPQKPLPDGSSVEKVVAKITLSTGAAKGLAAASAGAPLSVSESIARFSQYFPTRNGFPVDALAAGVSDPSYQSSSAGKTLDEAAADARVVMDAKYAAMAESGKPFDTLRDEANDIYALMGEFDRRSLLAIRSNTGGHFSKDEQAFAAMMMGAQAGLGTGSYTGPSSLADGYNRLYARPSDGGASRLAREIIWLERASEEEKATVTWALARAGSELNLLTETIDWSKPHLGLDPSMTLNGRSVHSDHPLARLIMKAIADYKTTHVGITFTYPIDTADRLKSQTWMAGLSNEVDKAVALAAKRA